MNVKNWWLTTLKGMKTTPCPSLRKTITADYLVIGGGIAGLHAAQQLLEAGKKVVLVEKTFCGGSSSGKSSGFLTPDSELEVDQLLKRYGPEGASITWNMAVEGVAHIIANIKRYHIECDLQPQDTLYLGIGARGKGLIEEEVRARNKLHYPFRTYNKKQLQTIHPANAYTAGMRCFNSWGINSLQYVHGLKEILVRQGLKIYENTPVITIKGTDAQTAHGSIHAQTIIVCIDKMKPSLSEASKNTYHAQTFLSVSEPLTKQQAHALFPEKPLMCWDSQLIYTYYRLLGDKRLLVGGGSMLTTYYPTYINRTLIPRLIIDEFKSRFPHLKKIRFTHCWPGLIDITRDLMPIVDHDEHNKHIIYVQGCPGLPWAAFGGTYAAALAQGKKPSYKTYLGMQRKFFISNDLQDYIGKIPSFALNNLYVEYKQEGY